MSDRSAGQHTRRILLLASSMRDDPDFQRLLNEQGEVRAVGNVAEALDALEHEAFDLVVTSGDALRSLGAEATASRLIQQRIQAIEAAGCELVRLDTEAVAAMDPGERLQILEDRIIRHARDLLNFDHFVIRVLDKQNCRLNTVFAAGLSESAKALEIYAFLEGNGITGYVAASGRSCLCTDITADPRYLPGLEQARSSVTVPLLLHDQVVGTLNAESDQVGAFSDDDLQIAEIFGHYVAIALHMLQLLAVERHTAAGQIVADASAEMATPLNTIAVQANALLDQCANDEAVCRRARAVIDGVERVKRALKAMSEQPDVGGVLPEPVHHDPVLSGKHILVADDEDIIRETIADMLARQGAETAMAHDGNEAVALVRSQRFDLVLTDIKMPHKSGYEVFAAAREANAGCPVILITGFGYDPEHSIVRASQEGLAGVLFKPFKVEKLVDEVRQALSKGAK